MLTYSDAGFAMTFGVFQDYYSTHEPFIGEKNVAVIGTMAMVWKDMSQSSVLLIS